MNLSGFAFGVLAFEDVFPFARVIRSLTNRAEGNEDQIGRDQMTAKR